jgi:hypothetical protein
MYKVHFLDDKEFEQLPGEAMYSKIGVAYPEYQEAYVRKSGSNVVDVFTALHEMEHLDGKSLEEHFDKENKCYYKDFGSLMAPIGTVLGTIAGGPLGPAFGGMLGQMGASQMSRGGQQQPQQQQQPGLSANTPTPQGPQAPAVSQAPGTGAGAGAGFSGGQNPLRSGLGADLLDRSTPYNPMNAFGRESGR